MAKEENVQASDADAEVVDAEIVQESEPETAPGPEPKTVEAAKPQKPKGGKAGWIIAAMLAAFVGGLFAAPYGKEGLETLGILTAAPVQQTGQPVDYSPAIAELKARLEEISLAGERRQEMLAQHEAALTSAEQSRNQLQNDLGLVAGQQGGSGASGPDVAALQARLTSLTDEVARLAALSKSENPEVAGLTGSIALARAEAAQLKGQLEALETLVADLQAGSLEVSPRGRMLLALGRMKDQAARGLPLASEIDSLRADLATLPALDQQLIGADVAVLVAHPDGIRPYEALVRDFDGAASAAKRAQEKADGSLLANLFTVRRTDDGASGIDAILLSAERRLLARDVAGSLEELAPLTGAAAEAMTNWRRPAEAYVVVTGALNRLQSAIANTDTPAGGSR